MSERRRLAAGKEIWVIKAGFPNKPTKIQWSDYVFSNTMKKYLEKSGCYVEIESKDEWDNDEPVDVIVSLRGPYPYIPEKRKKDCIYIMWNLSHPDTITEEEYNSFDLVCVGSAKESYIEELEQKLYVPVKSLPMCVDTELFFPDPDPHGEKKHEWVFVGNSRYKERKSVSWAIAGALPLEIWGAGWKNFIPDYEKYVVADNIQNDKLPKLYHSARATFDDHYDDMIKNGFINTRILEAAACGLPVISDYSDILEEMFGEAVLCYRSEEEFYQQVKRVEKDYGLIKENTMSLWETIKENYSFEHHMRQLRQLKDDVILYSRQCREALVGDDSSRIGRYYVDLKHFFDIILEKQNLGQASEMRRQLKERYLCLNWQEKEALESLPEEEKALFEICFLNEIGKERDLRNIQRNYERLVEEKAQLEEEHKKKIENLEKQYDEKYKKIDARKQEINQKLQKAYREKSEINQKLQKTYEEKSEINRKLQITYDEKYERGLEIKRLNKELNSIKKSRSYKLARMIGWPIRKIRNWYKNVL